MNDDNKFDAFINTKIKNFRGELFNSEEAETNFCPLCLICPMVESPESRNFFVIFLRLKSVNTTPLMKKKEGVHLLPFVMILLLRIWEVRPVDLLGILPMLLSIKMLADFQLIGFL